MHTHASCILTKIHTHTHMQTHFNATMQHRNDCPELQFNLDFLFQSSVKSVIETAELLREAHMRDLKNKIPLRQLREESAGKPEVN